MFVHFTICIDTFYYDFHILKYTLLRTGSGCAGLVNYIVLQFLQGTVQCATSIENVLYSIIKV